MVYAVALSGEYVSPRLDTADRLLVVDVADGAVVSCGELDIHDWPARSRPGRLVKLKPDAVVCGVLTTFDEAGFNSSGVRLIRGVAGPSDVVAKAIAVGEIADHHDYWARKRATDG